MRMSVHDFLIGTLTRPKCTDSHAWGERWCVNCVNMWVATLGPKLNVENAIVYHLVILLHELTHIASGEFGHGKYPFSWDETLARIVKETRVRRKGEVTCVGS